MMSNRVTVGSWTAQSYNLSYGKFHLVVVWKIRMEGEERIRNTVGSEGTLAPDTGLASFLQQHTTIFPFSLAEITLRPHCYPRKKTGLTLLTAASLAYVGR